VSELYLYQNARCNGKNYSKHFFQVYLTECNFCSGKRRVV